MLPTTFLLTKRRSIRSDQYRYGPRSSSERHSPIPAPIVKAKTQRLGLPFGIAAFKALDSLSPV